MVASGPLAYFFFLIVLIFAAAAAAQQDLRENRVSDWQSILVLVSGVCYSLVHATRSFCDIAIALALGVMLLLIPAIAYRLIQRRDGLGVGDLFFVAALATWLDPRLVPVGVALSALLSAIFGYILSSKRRIPFAPGLAIGFISIHLMAATRE